jgi:hypothetical protein
MKLHLPPGRKALPVSLDGLADQLQAARSARVLIRQVMARTGCTKHQQEGVWDFRHQRGLLEYMEHDSVREFLCTGPYAYGRLSPEERQATDRVWKWECERESNWATEHAESIASIRHLSHPTLARLKDIQGEQVYHYSLRIKSRPDAEDPLLAAVHEFFKENGVKKLTFEAWIGEDGQLFQTREHSVIHRSHSFQSHVAEVFRDFWDFGVELPDLSIPSPHQVLWPVPSEAPRAGLTVLIDEQESRY